MEQEAIFKKKILYLATHRGTREADLVLGGFARHILEQTSPEDLFFFMSFLTLSDEIIMDWLLKDGPLPEGFQHPFLQSLQVFTTTGLLINPQEGENDETPVQSQSS